MTPPPQKKKYPQNLHTPKTFIFMKTPKNIEIQNVEPKKLTRAYVCSVSHSLKKGQGASQKNRHFWRVKFTQKGTFDRTDFSNVS